MVVKEDSPYFNAGHGAPSIPPALTNSMPRSWTARRSRQERPRSLVTGETVEAAAAKVIHEDLKRYGIGAGLIAIGADGSISLPFNTSGMYHGWIASDGQIHVASHEWRNSILDYGFGQP